jgi:hypothetical protein
VKPIRPLPKPGKVIGLTLAVMVTLIGAVDCYRYDDRAFEDAYLRAAGGEVEVSLTGTRTPGGKDLGSPYSLMVRYLAPDSAFLRAELVSLSIHGVDGSNPVTVRADSADHHLRRIPAGIHYWKSTSTPVAGGNFAVALWKEGIPLEYSDKVVTGRLRLVGSDEVREIPFRVILRTRHDQEMRSRFWDVASSV